MASKRTRNDSPLRPVPSGESRNLLALRNVVDLWMMGAAIGLGVAGHLPEYLASQGVLVVGSLTDDEVVAWDVDREPPMQRAEIAAAIRERLEGLARGSG